MKLDNPIPFSHNRFLHSIIVLFLIFWCASAISPKDPTLWWMENILLFGTLITLIFTYKKFPLSNLSYMLIFIFLCLHTFAAHYTYESTPVDTWLKSVLHTKRSYFDRFMHFLFGLTWIYPVYEIMPDELHRRRALLNAIPLAIVFSFSCLYEIIEMIVAELAKQTGQQYIGLQGDVFDTQKDMALGLAGGLLATIIFTMSRRKKHSP